MTTDEIIKLAREADRWATNQTSDPYEWNVLRDERFAALVRNATLEECASVAWGPLGWQALDALELRCGTNAEERNELIPALRERLG